MRVICQRRLISSLVHCLFFRKKLQITGVSYEMERGGFIMPSTAERKWQEKMHQ